MPSQARRRDRRTPISKTGRHARGAPETVGGVPQRDHARGETLWEACVLAGQRRPGHGLCGERGDSAHRIAACAEGGL